VLYWTGISIFDRAEDRSIHPVAFFRTSRARLFRLGCPPWSPSPLPRAKLPDLGRDTCWRCLSTKRNEKREQRDLFPAALQMVILLPLKRQYGYARTAYKNTRTAEHRATSVNSLKRNGGNDEARTRDLRIKGEGRILATFPGRVQVRAGAFRIRAAARRPVGNAQNNPSVGASYRNSLRRNRDAGSAAAGDRNPCSL